MTTYSTKKVANDTVDWIYPRVVRTDLYEASLDYSKTLVGVLVAPASAAGNKDEGEEMLRSHTMARLPENEDAWIHVAAQDKGNSFLDHIQMENSILRQFRSA